MQRSNALNINGPANSIPFDIFLFSVVFSSPFKLFAGGRWFYFSVCRIVAFAADYPAIQHCKLQWELIDNFTVYGWMMSTFARPVPFSSQLVGCLIPCLTLV
jgi:hypothetical protein